MKTKKYRNMTQQEIKKNLNRYIDSDCKAAKITRAGLRRLPMPKAGTVAYRYFHLGRIATAMDMLGPINRGELRMTASYVLKT